MVMLGFIFTFYQSGDLPLVGSYKITLWFHCSSAQDSILYTTNSSYLTCILMALPVPWLGLCSPSHQAWARCDLNLRGNKVLQMTFPRLKHQIRFYKWKSEPQNTIYVAPSVQKKKRKQPAVPPLLTLSDIALQDSPSSRNHDLNLSLSLVRWSG